ncbi:prephenate dehydrogenase [Paludibacterium paludis]|uniref:prephenate dehydrogenase n=1 Tax=Paludibacterium paludis TaxID=1225769 RepID=UPI001E4FD09A|nr:prephenate dehydrogenase/arogenate dehydrogenase family protein [Paludibacterium paludis]
MAVVGVGLIGGSFALSLKKAGLVERVVGVGRSLENLERALELGVVDAITRDAAEAAAEADVVFLATPVGQMERVLRAMAPVLAAGTLVTDAGSTKSDVVALFRACLPTHLRWCVPAHPIAGAEMSGAAAARYGLFENRDVILTPLPESDADSSERVAALWKACGAHLHCLTPAGHDAVFASVSHLPHLLAFAYVDMIAGMPDARTRFDFAATGFRDFTRIAGSSPEMWRDIALANRDALLGELSAYRSALDAMVLEIERGEGGALAERFTRAREARHNWYQSFLKKG